MGKFDVNEFFKNNPGPVRRAIVTKRGRMFSIQASRAHYCSPKENDGPYTSVEVMVCNGTHPAAFIRANGGQRPTNDGIYGWLPISVLEDVINRIDGGVKA